MMAVKVWACVVAMCLVGGAQAAEYYVKDLTTDWTKPSSFTMDAAGTIDATVVPGAAADGVDVVFIPSNATATVDAASSLAVINRLARIRPMNKQATLVFSVPTDTTWTNDCPVHWDGVNNRTGSARYGMLRKQGQGTLELSGKRLSSNTVGSYDVSYDTEIFIDGGKLVMPQSPTSGGIIYCLGFNLVGEDTTLVVSRGRHLYSMLISGVASSLVTNAVANAQDVLYVLGDGGKKAVFNGRIQGAIALHVAANLTLTNPENTFTALDVFNRTTAGSDAGVVTASSFGLKGGTSALGTCETMDFGYDGAGSKLVYAGTADETTDKTFTYYAATKGAPLGVPHTLDAGTHGGLTFTGAFRHGEGNKGRDLGNKHIILGGNNENPCVIRGAVSDKTAEDGNDYCLNFEKTGTGIWRFADSLGDNLDRFFTGALTVREGTLQFDSLARQYDLCSVGLSTNRFLPHVSSAPMTAEERAAYGVDWAFGLGSETAATEGTLEYTGTADINAWSRPIGILGNARIKNDTEAQVRYLGLASEAVSASTLTLDGSGTASNEFSDVIDTAAAPISVVKKGAGKWVLGGDLAFHGKLDVQAGELVVRKYARKYTWYRLNCKSKLDPLPGQNQDKIFNIFRFGLYDADGVWRCNGLTENANFASLQPGQVAIETTRKRQIFQDRDLAKMFIMATYNAYGWYTAFYNLQGTSQVIPTVDDPTSHVAIELRLSEGVPPITSYDIAFSYGKNTPAGYHRHPNRWTLQGSVDGLHWDALDDYTMGAGGEFSPYWAIGGNKCDNTTISTHKNGQAIASESTHVWATLDNVSGISVAPGATLTAVGEPQTLAKLTINAATGAGTIKDFALAATGSLDVTNLDKSQPCVALGLTVAGSTTLDNLRDWNLSVDGVPDTRRTIVLRDGQVLLVKKGLLLIIR